MRRFNRLHVPDQWNQYFTKYPQGYTILEALMNWVQQVDDMIDHQNTLTVTVEGFRKELDDFLKQFDKKLRKEIETILNDWYSSGFLGAIINEAIETKLSYPMKQTKLLNEFYRKVRTGESFKIVARGDSLTYGYDIVSPDRRPPSGKQADNGAIDTKERATITYPEALQKYLNIVYPSRATVETQGFSGDTTETSYEKWFNKHGGDVTLIMLGTNDSGQNKGIENYLFYYRLIIERELSNDSAVILLTPPRRQAPNIRDDAYGNAVFQLGEEYGAPVVDMTELTSHMRADTFSDGTHFNGKGYEYIGARLTALFVGEGIVNPSKVKGNISLHGSRVSNSLELINGVTFANNAGYPSADEYTSGMGVGLNFTDGGKAIFAFYAEEDDLLIYPSVFFPNAGKPLKLSLDFGLPSQAVSNVYMFDQVQASHERSVPTSIELITPQDANWRGVAKDAFYINGVTSLDQKKIHVPKRGWHTLLIESDDARIHTIDFIGYRDMRDMIHTNAIHWGGQSDITLLNGWTNVENVGRYIIRNGIAYVEAWVQKSPLDTSVIFKLPFAPYFPSNFKVTNALTSSPSTIDPTLRVQLNGEVFLNHVGNTVNDTLVINISFPVARYL